MKIVLYVPLIDEGSQTFVSQRPAAPAIAGVAAVITRPLNGQVRPAIILSVDQTPHGTLANLVVFTDFGDPFRGATPDAAVRVARVPFSSAKEPGTFHNADSPPQLREYIAPGVAGVTDAESAATAERTQSATTNIDEMTLPELRAYAAERSMDLGAARTTAQVLSSIKAIQALQ